MCFTGFGLDRYDTVKWRDFADFGRGIRLDFEIIPKVIDFRKVYYPAKPKAGIPIMKQLFNDIPFKYSLPINFTRISKIGSYYIRNEYTSENEYRFLLKRTADEYNAWNLKHQ
jgi:hypothetical protein